ncbi:MAG: AMP-binding protein [Phycisphaerales bacterium]|nr:AMP-binding protein [Phycisphaerales bacterium]
MHPLLDRFEQVVRQHPARPAVADPVLSLSYAQLHAVAGGLAARIAALTDRPRVGILAPTSSACAAAILATWYAGRVPVPLNFLLAPNELARIIADAGIDAIVTIDKFQPLLAAAPLRTLLLGGDTLTPGAAAAPTVQPADLAVLLYTSGTSAEPKGVMLSFDNLAQNALSCISRAQLTPEQVFLSVLPQFHSFGFTAMTVTPLILGAAVHYLPRFSPVAIVETIRERGITVFMAVASMYAALAQMKSVPADAYAGLRLAVSGGEPLSPRVAAVFEQRFGIRLCEGYGLTETSPVVSLNLPTEFQGGSVGKALPGVRVVARDDSGAELPAGREGELYIRGHCVMLGYYNKPDQTAAVLRDGEFRTGDIGSVDADGFIRITGRAKEMLIIGGENVFPREIENVLAEHPAVGECAVIGAPDPLRGELPVAFVILREGAAATDVELREFCRERLAGYKAPREVRIMAELPRSPTGKILKRALRV